MTTTLVPGFRDVSPSVYDSADDPVAVGQAQIEALVAAARRAPNGRARLLLHPDHNDSLHEMVIALPPDSCDHPHINFRSGKSFLALSGQFAVVRFSKDGRQIDPTVLSVEGWPGDRLIRLRRPSWHTIIPLAGDCVFLETIIGPFTGNEFAPWFPGAADHNGRRDFAERLRDLSRSAAARLPGRP